VLRVLMKVLGAVEHLAVAALSSRWVSHALLSDPVPARVIAISHRRKLAGRSWAASALSAPRVLIFEDVGATIRISGAPNVSKPARLSSRLYQPLVAKRRPRAYSSGIGAHRRPAARPLVHVSRSYMPASCQRSIAGVNSRQQ